MCREFTKADARSLLNLGDLLQGAVGQRHQGWLLSTAKTLWPRPLLRTVFKNHGLNLLITATK
ncbi:MAG: hypothetical protein QM811_30045 [Pirellulales bacterium]